jgi:hypothetical protein
MHTQIQPPTSNQPTIQQLANTGGQGTIKLQPTTNHVPVAFVEFCDVHSAGQAMQIMQGKFLLSSIAPIRIEFAKSKMASNEQIYRKSLSSQMMPPSGCFQAPMIVNGNVNWQKYSPTD